jgi:hypothetical protein
MNPNGSLNFKGVRVAYRPGTLSQEPIPGVSSSENEVVINQEIIKNQGAIVRTINNPNLNAIRVKVTVPSLQLIDDKSGDIKPNDVALAVDVEIPGGGYVNRVSDIISGKTNSPYEKSYRIDLPHSPTGIWNVRVRRLTEDSTSDKNQNKVILTSLTHIIDAKFTYPGSALLWIRISGKNFSSLPTVKFLQRGKRVLVPSNYNAYTSTYSGHWDGTFKLSWTNNPVWILYDLLINKRYGMGKYLDSSLINKWTLYSASQYCDEMVSNFRGGAEKRFQFNGIITSAEDATQLLHQVASMCRISLLWRGGNIEVIQDKPITQFNHIYNPTNVLSPDGINTFNYSSSGASARHSVALVDWQDPKRLFETDVEYVENGNTYSKYGYNATTIKTIGCTSPSQAYRLGNWTTLVEELLTQTVTFRVPAEGAYVIPGEGILISDPMKQTLRQGGRIHSRPLYNDFILDIDIFDGFIGIGDQISFYSANTGQLVTYGISNVQVAPDGKIKITIPNQIIEPPIDKSPFLVRNSSLQPAKYRVLSVSPSPEGDNKHVYEITALQYNDSIYNAVDHGFAISNEQTTLAMPLTVSAPFGVTGRAIPVLRSGKWQFELQVNWKEPTLAGITSPYTNYYEVQYKRGIHGNWLGTTQTATTYVTYSFMEEDIYFFRVRSIDNYGRSSNWVGSPQTITTRPIPKDPIGTVRAELDVNNALYLSWSDSQTYLYGIQGYYITIQAQGQPERPFQVVNLGTYYSNPIDRPPGVYIVRIYALDPTGQRSQQGLTLTIGNEFAPANPNGEITLTANDDGTIQLHWTGDTTEYAESWLGYRLYQTIPGQPRKLIQTTTNKFSQPFQHPDNLGATYTVVSYNTKGYESLGNISLTLPINALKFTVPNPLGAITKVLASDGGVIMRWTDSQLYDPNRFSGYRIFVNGVQIGSTQVREYFSYFPEDHTQVNQVDIKAYYRSGLQSAAGITVDLLPSDFIPPVPSYLLVDQTLSGTKQFYWELPENPPPDITKFRVKYTRGSVRNWDNAHLLKDVLAGERSLDTDLFREGSYTIMIKSVDVTGLESASFVATSVNLFDPIPENVVESWAYHNPSASEPPMVGSPWTIGRPSMNNIDIHTDGHLYVIDDTQPAFYENVFTPTQIGHMKAHIVGTGNYRVEYRRAVSGFMWGETEENEIFWHPDNENNIFWISGESWLALPVEIQVHQEEYTVRIYWLPGGGILSEFEIMVDAPDLFMSYSDITISPNGTRVIPKKSLVFLKSVTMNLQDTGTGATRLEILDKDPVQGALVKALNSAGTPVSAVIDLVMVGY